MRWPSGKRFAFTIFDDPDKQTLYGCKAVYDFIGSLGFRTSIGVWPSAPVRAPNSSGETCANPEYLNYVRELQRAAFEVGYHNTTAHSSTREEVAQGLTVFHRYFGNKPLTMANHYNAEAIYWGGARLSGIRRALYRTADPLRRHDAFSGHLPTSKYFWGDLCKQHVRYCRNFVYGDINTLRACPLMPYYDPDRSYVNYWYASSEGANVDRFVTMLSEERQERLDSEGGACIMYTHFGHGFSNRGGLDPRFRTLMKRLSKTEGWFVPVSTLLEYLQSQSGDREITAQQRAALEWRWLAHKLRNGQS
jgi:hypothetical protein